MLCCANCFSDSFLNKYIPDKATQSGLCQFCSTPNTPLVKPDSLFDLFQSISSIYTEDNGPDAQPLITWFQQDWAMFANLDPIKAQTLLGEILDDGEIVRKKHVPRNIPTHSAVAKWIAFRNEIMWKNRFFFQHELDLVRLKELFKVYLVTDATIFSNELYRARIHTDESSIALVEMGKPAATCTRNGRANPVGIPYLYAASTPETAIAETRPHPGDLLSVARFKVTAPLKILNLQNPRKTISPFEADDNELSALRQELAFLCHLGIELSKPILPRVADLEYLPTQYLCEFIKNCGYDGVVFMSSIGTGVNVALFDDSKVHAAGLTQYKVTSVRYDQIQTNVADNLQL